MSIANIKNKQGGFTLIEILIVMFICSLAALPALYSWQQQLQRLRLIDAARQLTEFIYSHLIEGVYLNQQRILSIDITSSNWKVVIKEARSNKEIGKITASQFDEIEIKKNSRNIVELYGKQGTSSAFSLTLQHKNEQISLYMSAIGRIRTCSNQKIVGIPKC